MKIKADELKKLQGSDEVLQVRWTAGGGVEYLQLPPLEGELRGVK